MFKTDTLIVYCNPQVHGQATYEKVVKSVLEAREKQPLNFEKPEEGKENTDPQIIFTVSTTQSLEPFLKLKSKEPQAVLLKLNGKDSQINCLEEFLPQIEKIEGVSKEEFLRKAKNADEEFAVKPEDDEAAQNKKDTQKQVFHEARFEMQRMHIETDLAKIVDSEKLLHFATEAFNNKVPLAWLGEKAKVEKHSTKVIGQTFEKLVFDGRRDALVLVYHPIPEKNRKLKEKFDAFAKTLDKDEKEKLLVGRYNGINESPVFKNPKKLPALVYFSALKQEGEGVPPIKEQIEY